MRASPLQLTVESLAALRTPDQEGSFEYGVRLRLAGGPALSTEDPLLRMYGAFVETVRAREEGLQHEAFSPARRVRLEVEFDSDGDPVVGVWDAEGVRRAGTFAYDAECPIVAALDHGLRLDGLVLSERVAARDEARQRIVVLVHAPAHVAVTIPADLEVERPQRVTPTRVVLLADGRGGLGFWDASGAAGPADPGDLPLSTDLVRRLVELREAFAEAAAREDHAAGGFEQLERSWEREHLEQRVTILWRRARQELGRAFRVGLQAPGMEQPVWSPYDLPSGCDDNAYSDLSF